MRRRTRASTRKPEKQGGAWIIPGLCAIGWLDYRPSGSGGSASASLTGHPPAALFAPTASNPEQMRPAMSVQVLEREFPNDHLPLLRWLMFTGVCAFGFVLLWHYGLFRLMLASDKT